MSQELIDRIKNALENLITLEIITAVGTVKFPISVANPPQDGNKGLPEIADDSPKAILTRINLLQGDIKTVFDEEFVTGDYQSLKDFHAEREKEGYEIVQKNITALKELLQLAREELLQT